MSRNIKLAPGEFYHIYNRGVEKREIFGIQEDYERFLALLYLCNNTPPVIVRNDGKNLSEVTLDDSREALVDIYAYCLMPNHFHLLIREKTDGGISRFMQKLTTAYTMYFNMRYQRTGALFQGTYKASWVGNDRYLLYLISYIHLNPVKLIEPEWKNVGISDKNKVLRYLRSYRYSSFIDYCGVQRLEGCLIDKAALPTPSDQSDYLDKMISDWFTYQG